jgi:tyrosyl-tRNA synthetase
VSVWDVFRARGFFQQVTEGEALEQRPAPLVGYIGFDPTADSFHAGHLIPLMALAHFQREGHRPIALMGGGTAMIGDPTGKNEMRKMLSVEDLDRNIVGLKAQLGRLLDFEPRDGRPGAILADNADWLRGLGYLDFLRTVGPHFSVNRMLTFETFKLRLEGAGLSFLEFNYPLLQSYDFLELHRRHGCTLQMGGDDQWANIISGVDLVRRLARAQVFGWTFPLLTTASGAKMGKTERGAVWLDPAKTAPYDYYQYWINTDDRDTVKFLRLFTLLPLEEVAAVERFAGADLRQAKARLAFEATRLVHGEEEARRAERGARALFGGGAGSLDDVPSTRLTRAELEDGRPLPRVLVDVGLAASTSAARRLIEQGSVTVNDVKVDAPDYALSPAAVVDGSILLKVGKKKFHRLTVEG